MEYATMRTKAITYQRINNDINGNPRFVAHLLMTYEGDVMLNVIDSKLTKIIGKYSKAHNGYVFSTYRKPEEVLQEFYTEYWG